MNGQVNLMGHNMIRDWVILVFVSLNSEYLWVDDMEQPVGLGELLGTEWGNCRVPAWRIASVFCRSIAWNSPRTISIFGTCVVTRSCRVPGWRTTRVPSR